MQLVTRHLSLVTRWRSQRPSLVTTRPCRSGAIKGGNICYPLSVICYLLSIALCAAPATTARADLLFKYVGGTNAVDTLDLGVRPVGAWTEPFKFTMYSDGPEYEIHNILVYSNFLNPATFSVEEVDYPFTVDTNGVDLGISVATSTSGTYEGILAVTIASGDTILQSLKAEMYDPVVSDVVEKAYDEGVISAGFSHRCVPSNLAFTTLHNDYTLPFPDIPEGVDVVFKFTVASSLLLNASVVQAANGKVALYAEDFDGKGGPMSDNNYEGLPDVDVGAAISAGPAIQNLPLAVGTYFLVASSTVNDFEVSISTAPAPVPYLDPTTHTTNSCSVYTVYTGQTTLNSGWYVVDGSVEVADRIVVNGNVNLILKDNASLTASKGFKVGGDGATDNSLTVWAQSEGASTGKLIAKGVGGDAGIGGDYGGYVATADDMAGLIIHRNNATGLQWLLLEDAVGDASNAASGSYHVVRRLPNGDGSFSFVEGDLYERETLGKTTVSLGQTDEEARAAVDGAFAGANVDNEIIGKVNQGNTELGNYLQSKLKSVITEDHEISYSVQSISYYETQGNNEVTKYRYEIHIYLDEETVKDITSSGHTSSMAFSDSFSGSILMSQKDAFIKTITETVGYQTMTKQLLLIQDNSNNWTAYTRTSENGRLREYSLNINDEFFGTPEAKNSYSKLNSLDEIWFAYLPKEAVTTVVALNRIGIGEVERNGANSQLNGGYFKDDTNNTYRFVQAADQGACGTVRINGGLVMACAEDGAQAVGHGLNAPDELNLVLYGDAAVFTDALSQTPVTGTAYAGASGGGWARIVPRTAFAPVPYLDTTTHTTNTCYQYAPYDGQTTLERGWYVVADSATVSDRIAVDGDVHLILCDGKWLKALKGVNVGLSVDIVDGGVAFVTNSLTIWAQSDGNGMGVLTAEIDRTSTDAAIGGANNQDCGLVTINGGKVEALGGYFGAGIGGGNDGAGGTVVINGGMVEAHGGIDGGAGIGGGLLGAGGTVEITGGAVTAIAGYGAQAIGHGEGDTDSGDLSFPGMKVFSPETATDPVDATNRMDACHSESARLTPCDDHRYADYRNNGDGADHTLLCQYCGTDGITVPHDFGADGLSCPCGARRYVVTVEGGSTTNARVVAGTVVTVVANAPEAGKAFVGWESDDGVDFANALAAETTFTMPATNVTVRAIIARIEIEDIPRQEYTGAAIEPQPAVSCNGQPLVAGADYDFSYANNTNAGTATATVTMRSPRTGSASKTFEIARRPVTFSGQSETNAYTGSEIAISGLVVGNLVDGHTHNVMFSASGTDVGTYAGTITPADGVVIKSGEENVTANYAITVVNGALTIERDPALVLTVSLADGDFTYDGRPHAPAPATHNALSGATTVAYSKNQSDWTADLSSLTATDVADSCTIHVRATNPNYANTATASATLTIIEASVGGGTEEPGGGEVPAGGVSKFDASFVYDGKGHTIDTNALAAAFTAAMGEGTGITYSLDDGGAPSATWTAEAPAFTNVGEYVVWYTAANPNYEDFVHAAKVTIAKAANAWLAAPSMKGWTAGATPAKPNKGKAKFGTVTVAYGVAGGAAGGLGAKRPSKLGSYTATFTVPGTANYGGLSKTVSFAIAPKTYTVKFSANGGTLSKGKKMSAQTYTAGKAKKLRGNAFVRDGYVFLGWSTRKNGPVAYKNGQKVKNLAKAGKSVTLYAAWAKAEYNVVFDASGGRGKMPRQTFTYGESQNLRKNKFIRKGYVFAGWAIRDPLATVGKVAYKDGQKVKNLSADGRTVRLYAVWKRKR